VKNISVHHFIFVPLLTPENTIRLGVFSKNDSAANWILKKIQLKLSKHDPSKNLKHQGGSQRCFHLTQNCWVLLIAS